MQRSAQTGFPAAVECHFCRCLETWPTTAGADIVRTKAGWRFAYVHTQGLPDDVGGLAGCSCTPIGEVAGTALPSAADVCGRSGFHGDRLHPIDHACIHFLDDTFSGARARGQLCTFEWLVDSTIDHAVDVGGQRQHHVSLERRCEVDYGHQDVCPRWRSQRLVEQRLVQFRLRRHDRPNWLGRREPGPDRCDV